jgi:membrane protein
MAVLAWLQGLLIRTATGRALVQLVENMEREGARRAASAMAFDAFMSLIPLLGLGGWVLSTLHQQDGFVTSSLLSAAPAPVVKLLDSEFMRLSGVGAIAVAPISLGVFLWIASGGITTAIEVLEGMFRAPERPWWRRRLIAVACIFGGLALISLAAAIGFAIAYLSGSWGARVVAAAMPSVVLVGGIALFFRVAIRRPKGTRRRLLPGAVVTVALWSICSTAFSLYVRDFARYATLYGSLAAVVVLQFWLWLLALALLAGGEINALLEGVRSGPPSMPPAASSRGSLSVRPPPNPLPREWSG